MKTPNHKPLEGASRQDIECALAGIRGVMNTVLRHHKDATVAYEHSIPVIGDASALLHYVRRGREAEDEHLEALRSRASPREQKEQERPV
jgi:hypothetical protein